jgi:hypothetical protein
MSTAQDTAPQVAAATPAAGKSVLTVPTVASLITLALLIVVPMFMKNFFVFQLTIIVIYAIAILSLNILTGASGQVSLGHSAFFAVGAYACGIMMEHANIPYPLAIPIAGLICFVVGFLFGFPALRLKGVYLALATFALAVAAPPLFKLGTFEHWTGGVQGLLVTKPDAPFELPISQDRYVYYLTLAIARRHRRRLRRAGRLYLQLRNRAVSRHGDRRGRLAAGIACRRGVHRARAERRRRDLEGSLLRRVRRVHLCRDLPVAEWSPATRLLPVRSGQEVG